MTRSESDLSRKGGQYPLRIEARGEFFEACDRLRAHLVNLVGVLDGITDAERLDPSPHVGFVLAYDKAKKMGAL